MAQQKGALRIKISGVREIAKSLQMVEEHVVRVLGKALYAEGRNVIEEAGAEVPKDTGALYDSRFVAPPSRSSVEIKVTCGFGTAKVRNPRTGQATKDYAVIVHERLDVAHPTGKAKFLEDPLNRAAPGLEARLAQRVRVIIK